MPKKTITAEQVRGHLLERINSFQSETSMTDANVGQRAVGDHKIVSRIRSGENFTIKTYQRLIDWLDTAHVRAA